MPRHIVIKLAKIKDRKIIESFKGKMTTYKGTPIRLTADFSAETLQTRREWHNIFKVMKWKTYNQEYSNWQSYRSDTTEKSKALQTNKS